jgi:inosose dehydratase
MVAADAPAPNGSTYPFRLGYTSSCWGYTPDLESLLGTMKSAGFEGVEFNHIGPGWLGTPARMREMFDRHGLEPVAMLDSISIGEDAKTSLETLRRLIEYGADLGCRVFCLVGATRVAHRPPTDDEYHRLAEQAEALIDTAEPLGVTVAYHAHPLCTCESEAEQDRLLALTRRLKVCVDVSIAQFMQEDPVAQLRKYSDRLAYVHMKDWTQGKFCVLGDGTFGLDVPAVLRTLTELDYSGWVMTELSGYSDYDADDGCRRNRAYLRSIGY